MGCCYCVYDEFSGGLVSLNALTNGKTFWFRVTYLPAAPLNSLGLELQYKVHPQLFFLLLDGLCGRNEGLH